MNEQEHKDIENREAMELGRDISKILNIKDKFILDACCGAKE